MPVALEHEGALTYALDKTSANDNELQRLTWTGDT